MQHKMKNTLVRINKKLDSSKENISELKDVSIENFQKKKTNTGRKKKRKKNEH